MKDYGQYTVEDFVLDEDFIRWVLESNADDAAWWQQWLLQNPHKQPVVSEARAVLLSMKIKEKTIGAENMEQQIKAIIHKTRQQSSKGILTSLLRWKYAAALIGLIATGAVIYYTVPGSPAMENNILLNRGLPQKTENFIEVTNSGTEDKTVQLEDGSTVRLAPQSTIRYPSQMALQNVRDVYLSGEAFFEVAKNPKKPFRVFSQELVTKVLGTSFTVKANDREGQISIIVRTGKVSVYDKRMADDRQKSINHKNLNGVVLTPNQELVYLREQQKFQKVLVDHPVLINPAEIKNNFQYDDVPVAEVLRQLEKAFGINIFYDKEAIESCRVTADLSDESIYKKLELICWAMDADYEVIDGQVTIEAKPCE